MTWGHVGDTWGTLEVTQGGDTGVTFAAQITLMLLFFPGKKLMTCGKQRVNRASQCSQYSPVQSKALQ